MSEVEAGLPTLEVDPVGTDRGGAVIVEENNDEEGLVMLVEVDLQKKSSVIILENP